MKEANSYKSKGRDTIMQTDYKNRGLTLLKKLSLIHI